MKAIILAAGMGTRLRPLTDSRPKCLVELHGKPLIDYQIDTLRSAGIEDIHVVGGYLAHMLERPGITLHVNPEFDTTNMVFTLFQAEKVLDSESDVIVSYGDIVYEKSVLDTVLGCKADLCVAADKDWLRYWEARMDNPLDDVETFKVTPEGFIMELGAKPKTLTDIQGQFMGLMKFQAHSLNKLIEFKENMESALPRDSWRSLYMTDFVTALIRAGWPVKAAFTRNGWLEVDSVDDLTLGHLDSSKEFFDPEKTRT